MCCDIFKIFVLSSARQWTDEENTFSPERIATLPITAECKCYGKSIESCQDIDYKRKKKKKRCLLKFRRLLIVLIS